MFYHLLYPLKIYFSPFNVFKYLTFRSSMAIVTSFLLALIFSPYLIRKLKRIGIKDFNKREGCETLNEINKMKIGTPTMGGIIIFLSFFITLFLWGKLSNQYVWLVVGVMLWMGILGILDDKRKLLSKSSKGIDKKVKLLWQGITGLGIGIYLYYSGDIFHSLTFPFFKNFRLPLGYFYPLFASFFFVSVVNAVNVTDGLDGLATGSYLIAILFYGVASYIVGNIKFSSYLFLPYIKNSGELAVLCSSLFGAGLGFLWFNAYPADVFMGDTGAMALGGVLATVALITKHEILIILVGGAFVIEGLSVLIQVIGWKLFKKRVFLIAPLHHQFQYNGVPETKITLRMWIISIILVLIAFSTFKLR